LGTTRIKATLDANNISCTYYRDFTPGENTAPINLLVKIKHRYLNTNQITKEITLEEFTIPSTYLETTGLSHLSQVQQKVDFNITNLRYLKDLFVEVHETRDTIPIVTTAIVLTGDDETVLALASNPQKDIENDENIPEVLPEYNISDPEDVFSTILFSFDENKGNVEHTQISKRIYLDASNQIFVLQDYNEKQDRIFIENSISNLIPNSAFLSMTSTHIPDNWSMEAPGIIINSDLLPSDIEGVNKWQLRITNPNLFSAFNSATLFITEPQNLILGLNNLTFSIYYCIISTTSTIPFTTFNVRFRFFMGSTEIGVEQISLPVSIDQNKWELLIASIQGSQIRLGANKYVVEIDIADIDTTDLFNLELILPQLEPTPYATTRTLDSRVQDGYLTESFRLDLPFYMIAETYHLVGSGLRGIFSSTTSLKNGIEFQVSSDRLFFKQYDITGNLILNIASDIFSVVEGDDVIYGIWVEPTKVEFYINGGLISSHTTSVMLDQTKNFIMGATERANSSINSELLDFMILRVKP
jgi:hypothetical protein